jgi:hypothetical protein
VIAALALSLALVQGVPLTASAVVDREQVGLGDEVILTITARSEGSAPFTLVAPSLPGFEVTRRTERREVGSTGARMQVWEYRLRATAAGKHSLGPLQVVQEGLVAQAAAIEVEVVAVGVGLSPQLSPRLRALLQAAPPPPDSGAQVIVLLSHDSAVTGEQIDVVTTAWFPRELRLRMRRQPTLEPPSFAGVWTYPQSVPAGIVGTRQVGEVWYDQFAYHQVVFPLSAGPLVATPAVLRYSVPVAFQFFSQEERFEIRSALPRLAVRTPPEDGRPAGYDGAVGSGILVTREVEGTPRVGEPVGVKFTLRGRGNVSLWPAPFLRWPTRLQVYPEGTDERLDALSGVLGGEKSFRYLVVPDSSGALAIPTVAYRYFDPESGSYQTAEAAGVRIPVAAALSPVASRAEPPPLLHLAEPGRVWQLVHRPPSWVWGLLIAFPLIVLGVRRLPRPRRMLAVAKARRTPPWIEVQHRLERSIHALVGEGISEPRTLARALRAAGADGALADRVVATRARVAAERFARGGGHAPAALLDEARHAATALEALARRGRPGVSAVALIAGLLVATTPAGGQQIPAERLYETGAYRSAYEAFSARASAAPAVVAHWYGAGASAYRLGEDAKAAAAWTRAAQLAPRSRTLSRALLLLPAPDVATSEWRRVPPITAEEWFLGAVLLWSAAWLGVWWSGRWRGRWAVVAAGALIAGGLAAWSGHEVRRPLGLLAATTPLRVSPHGRAPGSRDLPVGTALRPSQRRPGWVLVRAATGEIGWVSADQVAWVRE